MHIKILLTLLITVSLQCTTVTVRRSLSELPRDFLQQRQDADMKSLLVYRNGLNSIILYLKSGVIKFSDRKTNTSIIPGPSREEIRSLWKSMCDYYLAIDSIDLFHRDYLQLDGEARKRSFHICRFSLIIELKAALDFIEFAERIPGLDTILNDSIDGIGLPAGTYNSFKFRFLNITKGTEFAAFESVKAVYGKPDSRKASMAAAEDSADIWRKNSWKAGVMTVKNGIDILSNTGKRTWFPVQKVVSELAGDTKVYRLNRNLITEKQISEIRNKLKPGDILLERREWYLTNIGIPGFWTHAAIYIGTPEERASFFNDEESAQVLKAYGFSTVEDFLRSRSGDYRLSITPDTEGKAPRVIEAVSEGVIFTTVEHSASCDSIAVLRPTISKADILKSLGRAFGYSGKPYDFNFDFLTDSSLVCTELVYKSFEPSRELNGITFPMEKIMGRKLLSANGIAGMYAAEAGSAAKQLSFVLFYDGLEMKMKSVKSDEKNFIRSIKRPKWHVFTTE